MTTKKLSDWELRSIFLAALARDEARRAEEASRKALEAMQRANAARGRACIEQLALNAHAFIEKYRRVLVGEAP